MRVKLDREMYYNAVLKKLSTLGNSKTSLLDDGIGVVAYGAREVGVAACFDGFVHRWSEPWHLRLSLLLPRQLFLFLFFCFSWCSWIGRRNENGCRRVGMKERNVALEEMEGGAGRRSQTFPSACRCRRLGG